MIVYSICWHVNSLNILVCIHHAFFSSTLFRVNFILWDACKKWESPMCLFIFNYTNKFQLMCKLVWELRSQKTAYLSHKTAIFKEKLFLLICCFKSFFFDIKDYSVQNWLSLHLLTIFTYPVSSFEVCHFSITAFR